MTTVVRWLMLTIGSAMLWTSGALLAQEPPAPQDDGVDVIELSTKGEDGKTTARGYVADYTGAQLKLRTLDGRETSYLSERVLRISTSHLDEQIAGDASFAAREYRSAIASYEKATQRESRVWVKRELLAQRIWCLRLLNQTSAAVKLFLALEQSDPQTVYYDSIPLLWSIGEAPDELKTEARGWLANKDSKAAQLIGASFLLMTDRPAARAKLEELAKLRHPSLPWLAQAQLWRMEVVNASADNLESWGRLVERMPAKLQGGPGFLVAHGWSLKRDDKEAALWFMRGPVLANRDRKLCVESLQRGGESYERAGQPDSAMAAYREIVVDYPDFQSAVLDAQSRLGTLASSSRE